MYNAMKNNFDFLYFCIFVTLKCFRPSNKFKAIVRNFCRPLEDFCVITIILPTLPYDVRPAASRWDRVARSLSQNPPNGQSKPAQNQPNTRSQCFISETLQYYSCNLHAKQVCPTRGQEIQPAATLQKQPNSAGKPRTWQHCSARSFPLNPHDSLPFCDWRF